MDLIKFGRNSIGFRGMMGRVHKRRTRGLSSGDQQVIFLTESGGTRPRLKFYTVKGGDWATMVKGITVSFYRRNTTPQWLCKIYRNTTNVGGTVNSGTSKTLAEFAAVFNAVTTDSLNSKIRVEVISEVNAAFHSSVDVGDGAILESN